MLCDRTCSDVSFRFLLCEQMRATVPETVIGMAEHPYSCLLQVLDVWEFTFVGQPALGSSTARRLGKAAARRLALAATVPACAQLTSNYPSFSAFTGESLLLAVNSAPAVYAVDPATGASWCPDCVDSKPTLNAALEEAGAGGAVTLLEVPLARAEYKGNPEHWARKHAGVRLKAIPTLFRWGKAAKVGELVEGQCMDAASVRDLVLE
jgi:thiol-disulfide isomerase/thioredoxin